MKQLELRALDGRPIQQTDFVEGDGWCVDLVQSPQTGEFLLVYYEGEKKPITYNRVVVRTDRTITRPEKDEVMQCVHFPWLISQYLLPVKELLQEIESVLKRCLDLEDEYQFVLACFVLSTWVINRLSIAPYVALVGPPGSGKTMALKVLHQLCCRGLLTSDISSAALYRACDQVTPTLFIDETATAGQQRTLFHLLRSGTTRDFFALRENRSYRTFGAKVVAWPELPHDEALNSRCIIIPLHASLRTDLLKPNNPEIVDTAEAVAARLFRYRLAKREVLSVPSVPGVNRLRPRMRDLYESLALAIGEDPIACARLLECLEHQQGINLDPLPANQAAVIGALYKQIHLHPESTTYLNLELTKEANLILIASGERFHMTWKAVGTVLTTFGFYKKRTKKGWVITLDRAARKRCHELMSRYGADVPSSCFPSLEVEEACEFCEAEHLAASESIASAENRSGEDIFRDLLEEPLYGRMEEVLRDTDYRSEGEVEGSIGVEDLRFGGDPRETGDDDEEDMDKYDQD